MSVSLSSFSHAYFVFPKDFNALHQNLQHDYRMNNGTHLSTGVGRTYWSISYQTHGWLVGWLDLRGREVMVVMQLGGKGSIASSFSCINGEMVSLRLHGKQLWRWRWRSCSSDTLRHSLRIQSAECTRCRHRIPLNPMAHAKRWCQVDVKIAPCDLSCLVSRIHKYFNF